MKRTYLALAIVIISVMLSGCGARDNVSSTTTTSVKIYTGVDDNADVDGLTDANSTGTMKKNLALFESNDVTVNFRDYDDSVDIPKIDISVDNQSDRNVTCEIISMEINGVSVKPETHILTNKNGKNYDSIYIPQSQFDDNSITVVNYFKFKIRLIDTDTSETIDESSTIVLKM